MKSNVSDVWIKRLRFIGRGFNIGLFSISIQIIEKYYQLKESKLSLEYYSFYTYQNSAFIPKEFQEELGIPKLMYDIGERFPAIASLSGKIAASREIHSHDDSECEVSTQPRRKKKSNLHFFSYEGHSTPALQIAPDPASSRAHSLPSVLKSYHESLHNTRERFVKVWLNINERVSSKSKLMKEQSNVGIKLDDNSKEKYVDSDSNQYTRRINVAPKNYYRYDKATIRRCPPGKYAYSDGNVQLQPIPIINESFTSDKKVRFCINVICHEY